MAFWGKWEMRLIRCDKMTQGPNKSRNRWILPRCVSAIRQKGPGYLSTTGTNHADLEYPLINNDLGIRCN